MYKPGGSPFNKAENVAYGTFSRTAWGLALAWVVYACHTGLGGKILVINSDVATPMRCDFFTKQWIALTQMVHFRNDRKAL